MFKQILWKATGVGVFLTAIARNAFAVETDCSTTGGVVGGANCAKADSAPTGLFEPGGIFRNITNVLLALIGSVAVLMLIIGGLRYVLSNGNPSAIEGAKNTILYAIIGIIIALLAFAIVQFVGGSIQKAG